MKVRQNVTALTPNRISTEAEKRRAR